MRLLCYVCYKSSVVSAVPDIVRRPLLTIVCQRKLIFWQSGSVEALENAADARRQRISCLWHALLRRINFHLTDKKHQAKVKPKKTQSEQMRGIYILIYFANATSLGIKGWSRSHRRVQLTRSAFKFCLLCSYL